MSLPPTPPPSRPPPERYDATPPTSPIPASSSRFIPAPYAQPQPTSRSRPRLRSKPSLLDELLPTPASSANFAIGHTYGNGQERDTSFYHSLRRAGSVAVISIFLLSVVFLVSTDPTSGSLRNASGQNLRKVFGLGSQAGVGGAWSGLDVVEDTSVASTTVSSTTAEATDAAQSSKPDFEQYTMLRTIPESSIHLNTTGHRVMFIGDVHGSFDPLKRLMEKISYDPSTDKLIHVGDLIAKGTKNDDVLWWMNEHRIQGVRGNHDQPVLQWRAWMEWAGGHDWQAYVDSLDSSDDLDDALAKSGKAYPSSWEWKGEHWQIARVLPRSLYLYLLQLPLALHIPSLHSIVVHAGLLPSDPLKSPDDPLQPLVQYSNITTYRPAVASRSSEELSILFDVPQNQVPWNLINIRSVRDKGKHKGQVTSSAKKGVPWSDLWKKELARCTGEGHWAVDGMGEWAAEHGQVDDMDLEGQEDNEGDETQNKRQTTARALAEETDELSSLNCSPVTVIYGHAAGRGLDIKPFSKGLDSGCVYGRKLSALILGDIQGLVGQVVRVGNHQGLIVQEDCGEGGK